MTTIECVRIDKGSPEGEALRLIQADGHRVGTRLATALGVSRQVAHGYLQRLVGEGLIEGAGSTRARVYALRTLAETERVFPIARLEEDVVWRDVLAPLIADLGEEVRDIWHYGVTEMLNNAIDHSGGSQVRVGMRRNALETSAVIADDGVGIFLKIQQALGLHDARESILELAKGKLTTAPERHSGEGIFFTSRVMDAFELLSGRLRFSHEVSARDTIVDTGSETAGTEVVMRLANDSTRNMQAVFDEFADPAEYSFDKTVVPLRLAQYEGEKLVSRSQAKRVAHRFERFKQVVLDFEGISQIGQAFADELFRVFPLDHPNVRLTPINTVEPVAQMIRRVTGSRAQSS
jgi:anti-sigma regulatory factor (Ser/Thr protein kinase)